MKIRLKEAEKLCLGKATQIEQGVTCASRQCCSTARRIPNTVWGVRKVNQTRLLTSSRTYFLGDHVGNLWPIHSVRTGHQPFLGRISFHRTTFTLGEPLGRALLLPGGQPQKHSRHRRKGLRGFLSFNLPELFSGTPFSFFLVAAPLNMASPKRVPFFGPGSLSSVELQLLQFFLSGRKPPYSQLRRKIGCPSFSVLFAAFCQGMLGLNNLLPINGFSVLSH